MALAAIGIGGHMLGGFAHGDSAIVAGSTVTHDTGMIVFSTCKRRSVMADGAIQRRGNVINGFAGGRHTIMAGGTIVHDTRVIEYRR